MPVGVDELGCDFLTVTGRKFLRGPRGTGFLYVRDSMLETLEPAMIDHFAAPWVATNRYQLRDDARRFENWENAYALRAGLGVAVDYALEVGLAAIQERAWALADDLRARIDALPGGRVRDAGHQRSAIVSFTIDGLEPRRTLGCASAASTSAAPIRAARDSMQRRAACPRSSVLHPTTTTPRQSWTCSWTHSWIAICVVD